MTDLTHFTSSISPGRQVLLNHGSSGPPARSVQLLKYSSFISDEMMVAPRPENEEVRPPQLEALHILDSPNKRIFDRMTARLARVFQVPIALISFIDRERQWFKAQFGLPEELAQVGTSRDLALFVMQLVLTSGARVDECRFLTNEETPDLFFALDSSHICAPRISV